MVILVEYLNSENLQKRLHLESFWGLFDLHRVNAYLNLGALEKNSVRLKDAT